MNIIKKTTYETCFDFSIFSHTAELFIGYSLLQLSLYSVMVYYYNVKKKSNFNYVKLPDFSLLGFFVFFLSFVLLLNENSMQYFKALFGLNFMFFNDYLSFVSKATISLTVSSFFLSMSFHKSNFSLSNSFEYFSFVTTSALGSLILCSAGDLITAYLAIELQSISFYLMACSKKNSNYSIESGLKYFIIGSFSSAFFLLGSSYVYVGCGTLNLMELKTLLPLLFSTINNNICLELNIIYLGFGLICLSLFIKLAAAPFHLWSIDVYESSPTVTTYFFAVIPKLAIFVLLIRLFYFNNSNEELSNFSKYSLIFSLLSITVGALGGIEQKKLKSLLAYSSVGHTGYILLAFSTGIELSVSFIIYYLMLYMLSSLCFWSIFVFLKQKTDFYKNKTNKELGDFSLLIKSNSTLAFATSVAVFSLAGIPPLVGFLTKFGAFLTTIQLSTYLISVIGILFSVLSTFYYLRLTKVIFFENSLVGKLYYPVASEKSLLISFFSMLLLLLFINPSFLYIIVLKACVLVF